MAATWWFILSKAAVQKECAASISSPLLESTTNESRKNLFFLEMDHGWFDKFISYYDAYIIRFWFGPNLSVFRRHLESAGRRGGTRQSTNNLVQDILGQWVLQKPTSTHAQIVSDFFWERDTNRWIFLPLIIRH
jgi:hypothetical protein